MFDIVVAALCGLSIVFVTVAYRLSRTVWLPREDCPHHGGGRDAMAVRAWLRLRGRCAECGEPVACPKALLQGLTAALLLLVIVLHSDDHAELVLGMVLVALLVVLTFVDLETRTLPNRITMPGAIAAVVIGSLMDPGGEPERLLAGLLGGGFFLVVALAFPKGMGLGDVKLATMLGLFLGREVAAALLVALVAGVLVGLVIMRRKGVAEGRRTAVPFGPFLALGGVVALLVGTAMVDAYVGKF